MKWTLYKGEAFEDNRYIKIFYKVLNTNGTTELRKLQVCYYYMELKHIIEFLEKQYKGTIEVFWLNEK